MRRVPKHPGGSASVGQTSLDKAPRLSISIVIWILSSDTDTDSDTNTDTDTICQLNQFNTNIEAPIMFKHLKKQ